MSAAAVLLAVLVASGAIARAGGGEKEGRCFAAVFLVRGSVAGHNAGSYGVYTRAQGDSVWQKITRSNLITFGLGFAEQHGQRSYFVAAGNGLHRSTDGGKTWRILTGWTTEEILAVLPDSRQSALLYVATPFGVFRSADGGGRWERKMRGMDAWFVQRLAADLRDPSRIYAAGEGGVFMSRDGAESWEPLTRNLRQATSFLQCPDAPSVLLAGTEDDGLFRSTDGGASWSTSGPFAGQAIYALRASTGGPDVYAGGYRNGVWRSGDHGATWERLPFPPEPEAVFSLWVDPAKPDHVIAGTNGLGVYESSDRGVTWRHAGLPGAQVRQIEFYP
jgi:photosystem II stability/assembly factor-like uncharacterized protein